MDGRPTWTDCDEAGDYVVPNVLSPRDLVFRPDKMDETVPHTTHFNLGLRYGIRKRETNIQMRDAFANAVEKGRGIESRPSHTKGVKNGTSGYFAWRSTL